MAEKPFWVVWNPEGGPPRVRHPSERDADREAIRLAREHRGQTFIVLRSVCSLVAEDIRRTEYEPEFDGIPF